MARLTPDLLVRKGMARPVAGSQREPAPADAGARALTARPVSAAAPPASQGGSTSAGELSKLTVRISQSKRQALRVAAARRGVSLQAMIGDMVDALIRDELDDRPHCACLRAALGLDGGPQKRD